MQQNDSELIEQIRKILNKIRPYLNSEGGDLEFVDYVEDDKDDGELLVNKIKTNWEDAMNPDEYGRIDNPGTYTVTYYVTDSEGNTGKTTLKVKLEDYVEVITEEIIEE